jgi:7-carboxy-7-deazaguanine synthase
LKVNEIFYSIQGEGSRSGRPCLFIRLAGCPVRCTYCDTAYAFHKGDIMEIEEITAKAISIIGMPKLGPNAPFVELTGGEPLAQCDAIPLLAELTRLGYEVALETAGSHDIRSVPHSVIKIVDRKTPDSGACKHWLESNLELLIREQDELKFVLCSYNDYIWSKNWCEARGLFNYLNVVFSPAWNKLDSVWLAEKILEDQVPVRLQLQLHKIIWGPDKIGV